MILVLSQPADDGPADSSDVAQSAFWSPTSSRSAVSRQGPAAAACAVGQAALPRSPAAVAKLPQAAGTPPNGPVFPVLPTRPAETTGAAGPGAGLPRLRQPARASAPVVSVARAATGNSGAHASWDAGRMPAGTAYAKEDLEARRVLGKEYGSLLQVAIERFDWQSLA